MERFNNKIILIILIVMLAAAMYWWINKIGDPYQRVIGILIVAIISYFIGKIHMRYIIECNTKSP